MARALKHDFSQAFTQACSVAAIADSRSADDTLDRLILQCFVILDDVISDAHQLLDTIEVLFGLRVREQQIDERVRHLLNARQLQRPIGAQLVLSDPVRANVAQRIEAARSLEEQVKRTWTEELDATYPDLSPSVMWTALQQYLASAFRRHGLLATALLVPESAQSELVSASVASLLDEAVSAAVPVLHHDSATHAIAEFLTGVATNGSRASYIAQLANGAFSYFTLAVAPDVSARLRENLSPLVLFLDTNFLFGILDLSDNPLVEVSHELLRDIERNHLPFELRVHEETLRELRRTIDYFADSLRSQHWTPALSRAALTSNVATGIELRYHERNAARAIDVDTFFHPYTHLDVLLAERNIIVYPAPAARLEERADLMARYQEFIVAKRGWEKPYNSADHDMTVLDTVRQLRRAAPSSLEAGAIFLTCDYRLHGFDVSTSRPPDRPSTVLPNVLWQVLRPFVPASPDFDRSFAETFAIPEFRTLDNGASGDDATHRALYLLSSYSNLSEQTALRVLSNGLLLEKLKTTSNEAEARQQVELAILSDNDTLLEERAELRRQLKEQRLAEAEQQAAGKRQKEELARALKSEQTQKQQVQEQMQLLEQRRQQAQEKSARALAAVRQEKAVQDEHIQDAQAKIAQLHRTQTVLLAVLLSVVSIAVFEWLVHALHWAWLLNHPSSLALQVGFDALIVCTSFTWLFPAWRKDMLIPFGIAAATVMVGLLGH